MKKNSVILAMVLIIVITLTGCRGQSSASSEAPAVPPEAKTAVNSEEEKDETQMPEAGTEEETEAVSETGSTEAAADSETAAKAIIGEDSEAAAKAITGEDSETVREENSEVENTMRLMIGEAEVPVKWEDNESVNALRNLCPLTIHMSMYGGFEQVGQIGQDIFRADEQTVTNSGDIVLYSGNQIVIFYGSNSWAYTRLGHIDLSEQEMRDLLSRGDVTITLE